MYRRPRFNNNNTNGKLDNMPIRVQKNLYADIQEFLQILIPTWLFSGVELITSFCRKFTIFMFESLGDKL